MFQDPLSASNEINQHMPYITVNEININCLIKNLKKKKKNLILYEALNLNNAATIRVGGKCHNLPIEG